MASFISPISVGVGLKILDASRNSFLPLRNPSKGCSRYTFWYWRLWHRVEICDSRE